MKSIYIAGPMRGLPDYNYPAFDAAADALKQSGWEVENPAAIGRVYGTPEEINAEKNLLAWVMNAERRRLALCDAIFLLDGWEKSAGARKELALALALGLDIILKPQDAPREPPEIVGKR